MKGDDRIPPSARSCRNFGMEFKDKSFMHPQACRYNGYSEICLMRKKCVFVSHLCAERWERRLNAKKKAMPSFIDAISHGEAAEASRPILHG